MKYCSANNAGIRLSSTEWKIIRFNNLEKRIFRKRRERGSGLERGSGAEGGSGVGRGSG